MGVLAYRIYAKKRFLWPYGAKLPRSLIDTIKRDLIEASRIHAYTRVMVEFLDEYDDRLWVRIRFEQKTINIGKRAEDFKYKYSLNGRKTKHVKITFNGQLIRPTKENEAEIFVSTRLNPGDSCVINVEYEILYHQVDSELFVAYRPAEQYEFIFVDHVSQKVKSKQYLVELDPQLSRHIFALTKIREYNNQPYSQCFVAQGGLLPLSGVYLKWRKNT